MESSKLNLCIFASGSGSNFQQIAEYFKKDKDVHMAALFCNNKEAYALERAKLLSVNAFTFTRKQFYESDEVLLRLQELQTDWIVLAGFLWLIPANILNAYEGRIINIHPALLPHYGGKGMYGMNVHNAVIANKETKSGITIHYVNAHYDEGDIIFQAECSITPVDTPETLAAKIHELEKIHFPQQIEKLVRKE